MLVSEDATWAITSAMYWSVIEINIGILAASIPSFKSIARRYCPRLLGSSYEPQYDPDRGQQERNPDSAAASSRPSWGLRKFRDKLGRSSGSGSRSNATSDHDRDEEAAVDLADRSGDVVADRDGGEQSRTLTMAAMEVMAAAGYNGQHRETGGTENKNDEALYFPKERVEKKRAEEP